MGAALYLTFDTIEEFVTFVSLDVLDKNVKWCSNIILAQYTNNKQMGSLHLKSTSNSPKYIALSCDLTSLIVILNHRHMNITQA